MNLSINCDALLNSLQLAIGVVEPKQTLPVLRNVLLKFPDQSFSDQSFSVTATDLELQLLSHGHANLEEPIDDSIEITVPARKLFDICRALPEEAIIKLQRDKDRLVINSGRSRFVLTTLPAETFPCFGEGNTHLEFHIAQKDLNLLLQRSCFAMAQQDVRHYLNGMLIDFKQGKVSTVATDGHRFSMNQKQLDLVNNMNSQIILPRKGVTELMRLLKNEENDLLVAIGDNHLKVQGQEFIFTSKLLDGRFPDYEKIFPKDPGNSLVIDRDLLKEALMRVAILSNERFRAVRLHLSPNSLSITANNPEQEEAEETLSVEYAGPEIEVAFNVSYLLDVLNALSAGSVIKLSFSDETHRLHIEEVDGASESLFLIMPVQL